MQRLAVEGRRSPGAMWLPALASVAAVLALTGCGDERHPGEWTLGLAPDISIGADPVTPQTAFYQPAALGFDFEGNIYVLDSGNHRVQVFTPDGQFLRSMGGPGEGPGELGDPQGMFVHPDGRVWLADTRNRRLQPFSATGLPADPISLDFFPLDVVVTTDRIFVQRLPQANMVYGPDRSSLVRVLDRDGNPAGGFADPVDSPAGILYMLENLQRLAPGPGGGVALADSHFASRVRVYLASGALQAEIPVLYKPGAWAPLGRRPIEINESSLDRIARTSTDLVWDSRRRLYWVLSGYVDRTPEGEWIVATEMYRYDAGGTYQGSVMLPLSATVAAVGPDGRLWLADLDGVVHAFRLTDPDMESIVGR